MKVKSIVKLLILLVIFTITSCSDDNPIKPPSVIYNSTELEVVFFTSGQSDTPIVDWNDDEGVFSYSPAVNGLTINPDTGLLSWTNMLPEGPSVVDVKATNKKGSTTTTIIILNPFQGEFIGTYSGSTFYKFEFFTDGTIEVEANDPVNPQVATGTWQINGNEIIADYTYTDGGFEYSIKGTYSQTNNEVVYEGMWYGDHRAIPGNEGGEFLVTMDD